MVYERVLLQTIKFDLQVEHPYSILLKIGKLLKGTVYYQPFFFSGSCLYSPSFFTLKCRHQRPGFLLFVNKVKKKR